MRKLTKEIFEQKAILVHGEDYDYSEVEYVNSKTKVLIKCKICGKEFLQTPNAHLNGQGCPYCSGNLQLTKEIFIERSIEAHGNHYDYSKVKYINNKTKVLIKCKECGEEFLQTPSEHLNGHGCPHCGGSFRLTKEVFVEKAILVHGDQYDYSKVEYVNAHTKVLIKCKICGEEFLQRPYAHLSGQGCPHCSNVAPLNKEVFEERSILVHGEDYDYSEVEYVNSKTKVLIKCKICGKEFLQTPDTHLRGHGCPYCVNRVPLTKEVFIERSMEVHNNFYKYPKVEYVDTHTKVLITCPVHNDFWQTPHRHLSGQGCPHCSNVAPLNKEVFEERSILVHGEDYDYSEVEYVNTQTKVSIIHKKCGNSFLQTPHNHLRGNGCPHCKTSKLEKNVAKILTKNNINFIQSYKGFDWLTSNTSGDKRNRLELDFYLPEYSIGIECQGKQHFVSIEYFGGDEQLEYVQNNDILKKQLCEEHGVKLLFINYDDNVEEKLNKYLIQIGKVED